MKSTRWAVFLDRDGVLNQLVEREGRLVSPLCRADFNIVPESVEAVRLIREQCGAMAIVVTNQPDVARGTLSRDELDGMNSVLRKQVPVDDLLVCMHAADGCPCRKPEPGMLLEAARRWQINLASSFIIGDSWKDMEAGKKAGCTTILLNRHYNKGVAADHVISGLMEAVTVIDRLCTERSL